MHLSDTNINLEQRSVRRCLIAVVPFGIPSDSRVPNSLAVRTPFPISARLEKASAKLLHLILPTGIISLNLTNGALRVPKISRALRSKRGIVRTVLRILIHSPYVDKWHSEAAPWAQWLPWSIKCTTDHEVRRLANFGRCWSRDGSVSHSWEVLCGNLSKSIRNLYWEKILSICLACSPASFQMSMYSSLPQSETDSLEELKTEHKQQGISSSHRCHNTAMKLNIPQTLEPKTYKADASHWYYG